MRFVARSVDIDFLKQSVLEVFSRLLQVVSRIDELRVLRGFSFTLLPPCFVDFIALNDVAFALFGRILADNVDQTRPLEVVQERLDLNVLMVFGFREDSLVLSVIFNFLLNFSLPLARLIRNSLRWRLPLSCLLHHRLFNILLLNAFSPRLHELFLFLCQLLTLLLLLCQHESPSGCGSFFRSTGLEIFPAIFERFFPVLFVSVFDEGHGLGREALHDP